MNALRLMVLLLVGQTPVDQTVYRVHVPGGMASATVIGREGETHFLLTSYHQFRQSQQVSVEAPWSRDPVPAKLVQSDPSRDLALIAVEAAGPLPMRKVAETAPVANDKVFVIGWGGGRGLFCHESLCGGYQQIISAGPRGEHPTHLTGMVLVPGVEPGDSGGAVLDAAGDVVGVINSGGNPMGQGFAQHLNEIRHFLGAGKYAEVCQCGPGGCRMHGGGGPAARAPAAVPPPPSASIPSRPSRPTPPPPDDIPSATAERGPAGPAGPQGPAGPAGPPGQPGAPGKDGASPDMSKFATKDDLAKLKTDLASQWKPVETGGFATKDDLSKLRSDLLAAVHQAPLPPATSPGAGFNPIDSSGSFNGAGQKATHYTLIADSTASYMARLKPYLTRMVEVGVSVNVVESTDYQEPPDVPVLVGWSAKNEPISQVKGSRPIEDALAAFARN